MLKCNVFIDAAGWSDRATPWDRKVWCLKGI